MSEILKWFGPLWRKIWPLQAGLPHRVLAIVVIVLAVATVSGASLKLVSLATRQTPELAERGGSEKAHGRDSETNDGGMANKPADSDAKVDQKTDQDDQDKKDADPPASGSGFGTGSTGGTQPGSSAGLSGGSSGGGGSTPSSCALPNYPNESCTGVPAGTALATISGDYNASAGETITGKRITGDLYITGNNVVIRNSEIYGEVKNWSTESFTVEDSLIGAPTGCDTGAVVGNNNFTMRRVRVRNFAEGPRVEFGNNVLIQDSFFKFCNPGVDNHADGLQGYNGGSNVTVQHNTFDIRDVPEEFVTAAVFWADNSLGGMVYKDNLLAGGGFTIRIHAGTGHTVSGNKVVNNSWYFGPVSSNCAGINWSNNHLVTINSSYQVTSTVGTLGCAE